MSPRSDAFAARHRRMAHPHLLVGPAGALWPGICRMAKERPLHAVGRPCRVLEIGGDVPPFDAKLGMRAMVRRKNELLSRDHGREAGRFLAETRKSSGQHAGSKARGRSAIAMRSGLAFIANTLSSSAGACARDERRERAPQETPSAAPARNQQPLRRKHMERQSPSEGVDVDDRDKAPGQNSPRGIARAAVTAGRTMTFGTSSAASFRRVAPSAQTGATARAADR